MHLGVVRPAGVLAEGCGDQPAGVDGPDLAVDPVAAVGVVFDPCEGGFDGCVVGGEDLASDVIVTDGEQHRHRLGCGAGDVEAPDGSVGVAGAEEPPARLAAVHDGEEVVVVHGPGQVEGCGSSAMPLTRRLAAVEVVPTGLLDVVAAGVGALQGDHPGGHDRVPRERVHSSVDG